MNECLKQQSDASVHHGLTAEMLQVFEERIQHIEYTPPEPEPYYQATGREVQPKPVGEEAGCVVFQYHPMSAVNYVSNVEPTSSLVSLHNLWLLRRVTPYVLC